MWACSQPVLRRRVRLWRQGHPNHVLTKWACVSVHLPLKCKVVFWNVVGVTLSPETDAPSQYRSSTAFQLYMRGFTAGSVDMYPLLSEDVLRSSLVDPSDPFDRPTHEPRS